MNPTLRRRAVLAGFLVSGITGLVYQSIWIRMLTLIIGGTTTALTTVLIAFMGGLALGSFLFGGLADRTRSPLRIYALLEACIGIYAAFLPAIYEGVPTIYKALDGIDPSHGLTFDLLRFVLALSFFGLPATLMGGTLPLIVKSLSRQKTVLQVTVAEVYALNTFGATIGAFLTGFVVIPTLGLYATLYSTAVINVLLAAMFWFWLARGEDTAESAELGEDSHEASKPDSDSLEAAGSGGGSDDGSLEAAGSGGGSDGGSLEADGSGGGSDGGSLEADGPGAASHGATRLEESLRESDAASAPPRNALLIVFFLMGASSLSYEVLWHRLLGLSFGNSVYSISTMLTGFLMGIALGSWWLRNRSERFPPTWATLGWIEVAIALAAPLTAYVLTLLPYGVQYLFLLPYLASKIAGSGATDFGFWMLQLMLFLIGTLFMLIPTSLMGASFPLAVRLYSRNDVGTSVGRVYAANTFGSIVGLAATGFFLISAIGSQHTNLGWSIINALLGISLLYQSIRQREGSVVRLKISSSLRPDEAPSSSLRPDEAPSSSICLEDSPSSSICLEDSPSSSLRPDEAPSSSICLEDSPSSSIRPDEAPSSSICLEDSPSSSIRPEESPSSSQRIKDSPLAGKHLAGVAIVLALVFLILPRWNLKTLTSGVYYHVIELSSPTLGGDIVFHTEDDMGLVSVHAVNQWDLEEPALTVKVNGKFMAGGGNRVPVLHLFAQIPIFMRGEGAREAFVIGLGGGYTVDAALQHPFDKVTAAEISPGVIEAARVTRPEIFKDPRLEVVQEDARAFLLTGEKKYDVIISETSDPWMTGVANLYTVECFRWIRDKLAPGGVFGTWLQTRHKTVEDVRIILHTMQTVFPHFAIFELAEGDTLLVMSAEPLRLDGDFMRSRYALLQEPLEAINILSPWSMMGRLVMGEKSSAAYLESARINTDNRPIIEFTTPRSLNIGLKGLEVWSDFAAHAPVTLDMPLEGIRPFEVALLTAQRALRLQWYDRALAAIDQAEARGAPPQDYFRARVLFAKGDYQKALEIANRLEPSHRQAMLEAGALTFLRRFLELDDFLRTGDGWKIPPSNDWERRILRRRELLLETLDAATQDPADSSTKAE